MLLAGLAAALSSQLSPASLGLRPEIGASPPDAAPVSLGLRGAIGFGVGDVAQVPPVVQASLTPPAAWPNAATAQDSLLELWVNGQTRHVLAHVRGTGPTAMVERSALAAAGLIVDPKLAGGGDFVPLSAVAGHAEVIGSTQLLMLQTGAVPTQVFDARGAGGWASGASAAGFILRYDVAALAGAGSVGGAAQDWSVGAALSGSVFTPWGVASSTGVARFSRGQDDFIRLDTAATFENPQALQRWTVGDSLSSNLAWSRSVRFGGVQFARDFSLRPEMSTLPLPEFSGSAAAPSTVDVFVNAAHVYSADVAQGPFSIRNIPVVTGQGEAVVVVRDMLGREVTTTLPLYVSADLLAKGLSSYAVEFGALRRGYGVESFDYGPLMTSGSYRYGVSNQLTLEGHAEASKDAQVGGVGAAFALGRYGAATAAVAASNSRLGDGQLYSVSAQAQGDRFGLFGAYTGTSGVYIDVAAADGSPQPRSRLQLGANFSRADFGAIATSWISQRDRGSRTDVGTVSYTRVLPNGWYLGATAFYSQPGDGWAGQVFFRAPLGRDRAVAAWSDASHGRVDPGVSISRAGDPDGGLGYAVSASTNPDNRFQADAAWTGRKATVDVGVLADRNGWSGRALVSGDIVDVDGSVFAAHPSEGPFALVRTGQPGVTVYRENRPVATTNDRGEAVVADLTPNALNRLGVDPAGFPIAAQLDQETQAVAPRARSGVVVDFTPKAQRSAVLTLTRTKGGPPPAGSRVRLASGDSLVVGRGGAVFLRDVSHGVSGRVEYDGGSCRFNVAATPASGDGVQQIGAVSCQDEGGGHEG